jgi:hypothetical protein
MKGFQCACSLCSRNNNHPSIDVYLSTLFHKSKCHNEYTTNGGTYINNHVLVLIWLMFEWLMAIRLAIHYDEACNMCLMNSMGIYFKIREPYYLCNMMLEEVAIELLSGTHEKMESNKTTESRGSEGGGGIWHRRWKRLRFFCSEKPEAKTK